MPYQRGNLIVIAIWIQSFKNKLSIKAFKYSESRANIFARIIDKTSRRYNFFISLWEADNIRILYVCQLSFMSLIYHMIMSISCQINIEAAPIIVL